MPTLKSAKKRMRTAAKARVSNVAKRTEIKTARSKLFKAIEAKDATASTAAYKEYCSLLDKSAKKGVIKKNTAVRRKGRAAAQIAALSQA